MPVNEDWLGLGDADEKAAKRPAAFVVGPPMGNEELMAAQRMHLASTRPEFIGATEPHFTVEGEDGIERLPIDQAMKWRAIMEWPQKCRIPTLAEVEQFQAARGSALNRAFWDELRAAVIKDADDAAAAEKARNDAILKGFTR
jgi:hypothetical protein